MFETFPNSFDVLRVDPYDIRMDGSEPIKTEQSALALSIYMLDRIWKPPTYILNSRQSHIHTITLPNKFVRIYSNGRVLYSSRLESHWLDTHPIPYQSVVHIHTLL